MKRILAAALGAVLVAAAVRVVGTPERWRLDAWWARRRVLRRDGGSEA